MDLHIYVNYKNSSPDATIEGAEHADKIEIGTELIFINENQTGPAIKAKVVQMGTYLGGFLTEVIVAPLAFVDFCPLG